MLLMVDDDLPLTFTASMATGQHEFMLSKCATYLLNHGEITELLLHCILMAVMGQETHDMETMNFWLKMVSISI